MTKCKTTLMKWINLKRFAAGALALCCCSAVHASLTNVIWEASLSGSLGIQAFKADVIHRMDVSKIKKGTFLSFVLNQGAGPSEKLALNIDMAQGQTNFYLTVYSTANRENSFRVTTGERTTIISDGVNLSFSLEADLQPNSPQWGGGVIRIAGLGRMVNGVPGQLKGSVTGVFIDNRPDDLQGTTGIVLRGKFSTSKAPLRVQPAN